MKYHENHKMVGQWKFIYLSIYFNSRHLNKSTILLVFEPRGKATGEFSF